MATECSSLLECNENPVLSGLLHATASRCTPSTLSARISHLPILWIQRFQRSSLPVRHVLWRAHFHPHPALYYLRHGLLQQNLCYLAKSARVRRSFPYEVSLPLRSSHFHINHHLHNFPTSVFSYPQNF